jgi:hypothetical protein
MSTGKELAMASDKQQSSEQKDKPAPAKPSEAKGKPAEQPVKKDNAEQIGSKVEIEGSAAQAAVKAKDTPAAPAPAPTPAPQPSPAPAPQPEPPPAPIGLQLNAGDEQVLEVIGHRLDAYIAKMRKGVPVKPAQGAVNQKELFAIIDQILKLDGAVFNRAWSLLLSKALAERHGAFHEGHAYRFFEQTKLDARTLLKYRDLVHLVIHTCDPKSRQKMLKLVSVASVTKDLDIAGAADKLYGYYML